MFSWCVCWWFGFPFDPRVEHRHDEQGEESGGEDAADDDGGDGALDFGTRAGGNGHGDEAEAGDERGHELGPQAGEGAFDDGLSHLAANPETMKQAMDALRMAGIGLHPSSPLNGTSGDSLI